MAAPDKITLDTIDNCSLLLKYAAETITEKDKKAAFVSAAGQIETCKDAKANDQWSPSIAGQFWTAYVDLCSLISPVNIDTLTTSQALLPDKQYTLPQRSVRRYSVFFAVLLVASVLLSFVTTAVTAINEETSKIIATANSTADEIAKSLAVIRLKGVPDADRFTMSQDSEVQNQSAKLITSLPLLYADADKLFAKTNSVPGFILPSYQDCRNDQDPERDKCYRKGGGGIAQTTEDAQANLENYRFFSRRMADRVEISQSRINVIKATLLPMLFGMTGAVAYVIRMMSEQIRASSFSSSSPIRNFARVMLGALAGVAVGFTGILTSSSISGAALSFIAGYAIEPVFSTFDKVAATFK
jgi:hypothetical protein